MSGTPDVLIIGGGIVGAASAYHLARRGASVTLLEQDRLASGATGRNLGFIWVHTRRAGPELELVMATRNELEGLPEELGADFGLRTNGGLFYFNYRGPGRGDARVRRAPHGGRRPDAAARWGRGQGHGADPA